MCLCPITFTHTSPESIPIYPKPYRIFYRPNNIISHRNGLLLKIDNLHLYMNAFSTFNNKTEEINVEKFGNKWIPSV